uniref:Protein quiver n=1 Tax=Strongyloides stercoralis TaxID=6248 RepID=A0A0K0EB53_STRER
MIFFYIIFVLFLLQKDGVQIYGEGIKCTSCASKELEVNWAATTLAYPKNTTNFFDSSCDNDDSKNIISNCETPCFSMVITANSKNYIVRGCMSDFFSSSILSGILLEMNNTEYCIGSKDKDISEDRYYLKYCTDNVCNSYLKLDTFETNCKQNLAVEPTTCYQCNKLYGNGKCEPNSGSTCTGNYCVKVKGHYGDAKFEERRCSNINPYLTNTCIDTETQFPLSLGQSITGNEIIKSTVCYCKGNLCNSSTLQYISMTAFFFTIIFTINH